MSKDAIETLQENFRIALEKYLSDPKNQKNFDDFLQICIDLYIMSVNSFPEEKRASIGAEDSLPWIMDTIEPVLKQTTFPLGSAQIIDDLLYRIAREDLPLAYKKTEVDPRYAFGAIGLVWMACNEKEAIAKRQLIEQANSQLSSLKSPDEPQVLNISYNGSTLAIPQEFIKTLYAFIENELYEANIPEISNNDCNIIIKKLYEAIQIEILSKDSTLTENALLQINLIFPEELSAISAIYQIQEIEKQIQQEIEKQRQQEIEKQRQQVIEEQRQELIKKMTLIHTQLEGLKTKIENVQSSVLEKLSFFKLSTKKIKSLVDELLATIPKNEKENLTLEACEGILSSLHNKLDEKLYPLKNFCQGNQYLEKIYEQLEKLLNSIKELLKSQKSQKPQESLEDIHKTLRRQ
jgi:hypothetical protein